MKRIRIAWKIEDKEGHSLPFPPEQRQTLLDFCVEFNKIYGQGTHWIEEIEV
jgi:hypothetical protein